VSVVLFLSAVVWYFLGRSASKYLSNLVQNEVFLASLNLFTGLRFALKCLIMVNGDEEHQHPGRLTNHDDAGPGAKRILIEPIILDRSCLGSSLNIHAP
jgi:hypothetical protein